MQQLFRGLAAAIRTLSIIPVPGRDPDSFSTALYWFPLVGLLLGAVQLFFALLVSRADWLEFAGFVMVFSGLLLTRAIHADGFADLVDGFWGGKNRESALRIMKDPSVGSFGSLALISLLLLKWIAATRLLGFGAYSSLLSGVLLARSVQVVLASLFPYARPEGGTAVSFVSGAGWKQIVVNLALVFLLLFLLIDLSIGLVALSSALVAAVLVGFASWRKIAGVTGDVLGAASELTEVCVWICCALYLG